MRLIRILREVWSDANVTTSSSRVRCCSWRRRCIRRTRNCRSVCQRSSTGSWRYEHNGFFSFDKDRSLGGQQSYTNSIGYGVTPWWEVELEAETNSVPDTSVHYTATTMENTFQITEPGKYMFNLGAFAEYLPVSVT